MMLSSHLFRLKHCSSESHIPCPHVSLYVHEERHHHRFDIYIGLELTLPSAIEELLIHMLCGAHTDLNMISSLFQSLVGLCNDTCMGNSQLFKTVLLINRLSSDGCEKGIRYPICCLLK